MDSEIYREKSKKTFDTDAHVYDQTSNGKHSAKLYSTVIKEIESADYSTLLDVGCGTGNVLALLPTEKSLYGIDLSDKMIKIAQNRLPITNFVIGDSEKLPWTDTRFDVINCTDSFHHYPHPDNVLKDLKMAVALLLQTRSIRGLSVFVSILSSHSAIAVILECILRRK
jgi:ubiquinone/menaquinone biosynthesis C-methylase UbiE